MPVRYRLAFYSAFAAVCLIASGAEGQQAPPRPTLSSIAPELGPFFTGSWSCAGAFSSGRKIEASMTFKPAMNGGWLELIHDDVPPASFHAQAFWGLDSAKTGLVEHLLDSSGGYRLFHADSGWHDSKVVFTRVSSVAGRDRWEHFIFARESAATFRMTNELSIDGTKFILVDSMLCTKN